MTAQIFIDNVRPLLSGLAVKVEDATLLSFLNMAKDELARDTMLWINGEEVSLTTDITEYTLAKTPIQIIDIYDDNYVEVRRGVYDTVGKGYFQTSPNKIKLAYNPTDGDILYANYYITPDDYALGDEIDIPPSLYKATRHFIVSEALNMFKGEKEIMNAKNHYGIYNAQVQKFLAQTDTLSSESLSQVDMIKSKGLV